MGDDDRARALKQWAAGLSKEELRSVLDSLLGGRADALVAELQAGPVMPELPEPPAQPSALTVRVDVDGTKPPVWRRLVLHGDLALDEVHAILQAAFGWQDSHLHRFWPGPDKRVWTGPSFVTEYDLEEGEEGILETGVRLDQLLRTPGDRLFYTYDFGDDWTHTLRLESVASLAPDSPPAVCTGGRMSGPLEDCGGAPGHNELVAAYRSDPGLADLDEDQRAWLPPGWDPTDFTIEEVEQRLSFGGLTTEQLLERFAATEDQPAEGMPEVVVPLLAHAPAHVSAEVAGWVRRALSEGGDPLGREDLVAIARPYRYLVELAGDEGIPLTAAGWMRPAYVERVYRDLGMESGWIGKGNREDQTLPVLELRQTCQQLGLLRKQKDRLLRTPLARGLSTDEEYVVALASRLLHHRDTFVSAALGLYALLTVVTGRPPWEHADDIARVMTQCGLRTGSSGVDPRHVAEWARPVWAALARASGQPRRHRGQAGPDPRAVAVARLALWPAG